MTTPIVTSFYSAPAAFEQKKSPGGQTKNLLFIYTKIWSEIMKFPTRFRESIFLHVLLVFLNDLAWFSNRVWAGLAREHFRFILVFIRHVGTVQNFFILAYISCYLNASDNRTCMSLDKGAQRQLFVI